MDKMVILLGIEYIIKTLIVVLGASFLVFIRKHNLEKWVKIAVSAAEQMFEAELINIPKKDYVIKFIHDKFKFTINEDELDILIESAVYELNMLKELKEQQDKVYYLDH